MFSVKSRSQSVRFRIIGAVILMACGGGTVDAPSSDSSVASVAVNAPATTIGIQETTQLTATPKNASGATLTRTVTWSSNNNAVATVNSNGLVSGVAPGQATITATSDGKTGSATITVVAGVTMTAAGGTITGVGGDITLTFPPGAIASSIPITISPISDPVADPDGYWLAGGARYQLGPNGTQFAKPVTVTIRYDDNRLPPWALTGDITIQRWNGTQWQPLTNIVVNTAQHTISGQTTGFSTFTVAITLPAATLTPASGSVNQARRSVTFAATVPGSNRPASAFQFAWSTTGRNGTVGAQIDNTIQYTAVSPVLPAGDVDFVAVEIRGRREANGPYVPLASAVTSVKADLALTMELQPSSSLVQYSGSVPLTAAIFDRAGNVSQQYQSSQLYYEWTATQNAGSVSLPSTRTQSKVITYTAFPASQQSASFPKGDRITVKAFVRQVQYDSHYDPVLGKIISAEVGESFQEIGQAEAFVEVIPQFVVKLLPAATDVLPGQPVTLRVELEPAWQGTESLSFRWRNTGNYGDLNIPVNTLTQQSSVTYTPRPGQSGGADLIDVDVNVGIIPRAMLGTGHATVQVGPRVTAMWRIESATVTKSGQLTDPDIDLQYYNYVVNGMTALAARPGDNHIYLSAGQVGWQQVPAGQGVNVRGLIQPPTATHWGLAEKERLTVGTIGNGVLSGEFWIGTDDFDPTFFIMKNTINASMTQGVLQGTFTVMAWTDVVYTVQFRAVQIIP